MMEDREKIGSKQPFRVPDNYFNEVRKQIHEKTVSKGRPEGGSRLMSILKPVGMLAAAMIVFAIISYGILKLLFPGYDLPSEHDYTELVYRFDEEELIEALVEEDATDEVLSAEQSEIIGYLLDNDIENSTIIEYLN